ncbi:unnamed protein product [Sphenostylis stenocarpa]|uniref:Uncharacterized protein n=1 Tax=Sphenostylis stenocarpa TaxID=92480 RepID=A0AA86S3D2_9FABA|nr:unnamed protein product [Sphenostylis stenocarpa]
MMMEKEKTRSAIATDVPSGEDTDHPIRCELYVEDIDSHQLVVFRKMFEGLLCYIMPHHACLVKVIVEKVRDDSVIISITRTDSGYLTTLSLKMGRMPCCEKVGLKKGPWTPEEDKTLLAYVEKHGHGNWRSVPAKAGLERCGKSCRLRWINYLKPDIKRGNFSMEEDHTIITLHALLGNK